MTADAERRYYISHEGALFGPYDAEELDAFLTPKTLICREGEDAWHAASDIKELKPRLQKLQARSEPAALPGAAYYAQVDGKAYGPYSIEQLKEFVEPETHVRAEDGERWGAAAELEALREFFVNRETPSIKDWFYFDLNGKQCGPHSRVELEELIGRQIITQDMKILHLNWDAPLILADTKLFKDMKTTVPEPAPLPKKRRGVLAAAAGLLLILSALAFHHWYPADTSSSASAVAAVPDVTDTRSNDADHGVGRARDTTLIQIIIDTTDHAPSTAAPLTLPTTRTGPLTLFETPRDGAAPVVNAIRNAVKSVDVVVYELGDADVIHALIADQQSGRQVRVILNSHFFRGGNQNAPAFDELRAAGVAVHWSDSGTFRFTHEKAIIVDAGLPTQVVLIMTLNLKPGYLGKPDHYGVSLNFGVADRDPADVSQAEAMFNADWAARPYNPPATTRLVISPTNARSSLLNEIQSATRSIHFFAQEFTDKQIVAAMVSAARRGVEVKALLAPNISGNLPAADTLRLAHGQARYLAQPYEHAKATIVDGKVVYIGSINYTATSMDKNRELGILTKQDDIVKQMETEFDRFWLQGSEAPG